MFRPAGVEPDLVLEHADARVARREVGDEFVGAVDRRAERDEHLDGAGVVLREDRLDRRPNVRGVVEHGHDIGDADE